MSAAPNAGVTFLGLVVVSMRQLEHGFVAPGTHWA